MPKLTEASDVITPQEVARRRDETIKRMLATPPKPHAPLKARKAKASRPNPKAKPATARKREPSA